MSHVLWKEVLVHFVKSVDPCQPARTVRAGWHLPKHFAFQTFPTCEGTIQPLYSISYSQNIFLWIHNNKTTGSGWYIAAMYIILCLTRLVYIFAWLLLPIIYLQVSNIKLSYRCFINLAPIQQPFSKTFIFLPRFCKFEKNTKVVLGLGFSQSKVVLLSFASKYKKKLRRELRTFLRMVWALITMKNPIYLH